MSKKWNRLRADNIRENVPIATFLASLGYEVRTDLDLREQQFPCDLHGDGFDNKPSARIYPDTNSWFCFACNKVRDAIRTVQDREGVGFHEACRAIERRFGLRAPSMEGFEKEIRAKESPEDSITSVSARSSSFEQAQHRLESLLFSLTRERSLPMTKTFGLWEAFDSFCWRVQREVWTKHQGLSALEKLHQKTIEQLRGKT